MADPKPMAEKTDVELLALVATQDTVAFGELYDRLSGLLFGLAQQILGDVTDAEDVLQEAFLLIWNRAATYEPRLGKPVGWAVAILRNKAIDRLRSRQRRARLLDEATREELWQTGDLRTVGAATGVDAAVVRQGLLSLPAEQREAIELAFLGGLSQSEIAEMLEQPLGTIKARIRRGMLRLRELLTEGPPALETPESRPAATP